MPMSEAKFKGYLETATSVAVILVAIVILATFLRNYFGYGPQLTAQGGLERGQLLTNLAPVLNHGTGNQTILLVAMSTNCHFCEDSIPFYNSLGESLQKIPGSPAVVAVFPDTPEHVAAYAKAKNLKVPYIPAIDFKSLSVSLTPTMIWLDKSGKILDFWVGKLSSDNEKEVIKTLGLKSG
jgi:hypothetical protein